jgi:hypothetical protein
MDRVGYLIAKVEEVRIRLERSLKMRKIGRGCPLLASVKWSALKEEWEAVSNALKPLAVSAERRLLLLDCDTRFVGVLFRLRCAIYTTHHTMPQTIRRRDLSDAWNGILMNSCLAILEFLHFRK